MAPRNSRSHSRYSSATGDGITVRMGEMKAEYRNGRSSRFRPKRSGVSSVGRSADYHLASEPLQMQRIEFARSLDQEDMIVGQGITRLVDAVIGAGFTLDPETNNKDADALLKKKWKTFSEDPLACDISGRYDFHKQEAITFRGKLVDGDILAILDDPTGSLELIEAHRLRTPSGTNRKNVVQGVEQDSHRRPMRYWITKGDIDPSRSLRLVRDTEQLDAFDDDGNPLILHPAFRRRISQTRGVTPLLPVFDVAGMHDDIQFAKLVQQQIASCIALIREKQAGNYGGASDGSTAQLGDRSTETRDDGSSVQIDEIGIGLDISPAAGETIKAFTANIPGAEFFPHAMLLLTIIAINLGLPVAVLLLDPSQTNFSGWRGAIDQAREGFKRLQREFASEFHSPVYEWQVRRWIENDPEVAALAETLGPAIFAHKWNCPRWNYIQPIDDITASVLERNHCVNSARRILAQRGLVWSELVPEIVADNALIIVEAKTAAAKINSDFPDDPEPVSWRELLTLPTADRISSSYLVGQNQQEAPAQTPGATPGGGSGSKPVPGKQSESEGNRAA